MVWARSQYSGSANIGTWPTSSVASHKTISCSWCHGQAGAAVLQEDCKPCNTTACDVAPLHSNGIHAMQVRPQLMNDQQCQALRCGASSNLTVGCAGSQMEALQGSCDSSCRSPSSSWHRSGSGV